jgi:hypothetical protein
MASGDCSGMTFDVQDFPSSSLWQRDKAQQKADNKAVFRVLVFNPKHEGRLACNRRPSQCRPRNPALPMLAIDLEVEKIEKNAMGSVADKIAQKIAARGRSKVVDLTAWREGKEIAHEAGLEDDRLSKLISQGYDPCHALYIFGQNVAAVLSEQISGLKEAKGFAKVVGNAGDEYMPDGPPMSPLTRSYFTMWALFDVRFGGSRETMGTCILRAARAFDFPPWLSDIFTLMQRSRMGFYVHCGVTGARVRMREVGTGNIKNCLVPAGHAGQPGQIWFVRLLPPANTSFGHHVVANTPYVIENYPEQDFIDYMERELARMKARKPLKADDRHGHLMKYGPAPNHWNEYIFTAYAGHRQDVVFLTGIPDIPESLPHADTSRP